MKKWLLPENGMPFGRIIRIVAGIGCAVGFLIGIGLVLTNKEHGKREEEEALERLQRNILVSYERIKAMIPGIEKIRLEIEQTEERLQECEQVEVHYRDLLEKKRRGQTDLFCLREF